MDKTTRTIHLILQLEQTLKHMKACRDLSRREPTIDDAWHVIDEYRQKLIVGLSPREDQALELARATGDPSAITIINNRLKIEILVDRSSVDAFFDEGRVMYTSVFFPENSDRSLELFSTGGTTKLISLDVYELRSAWERSALDGKQTLDSSARTVQVFLASGTMI